MIQGGDPLGQGIGGPGYNFDDEIHPELGFNEPYVLAMANAGKRPDAFGKRRHERLAVLHHDRPDAAGCMGKHTIFGAVADDDSKRVVDAIAGVQTGAADRPVDHVVIASIEIASA